MEVIYEGYLQEAVVPSLRKRFVRGVPKEVTEEEAEILLSLPDFKKVAQKKKVVIEEEKEEGEE